MNHQKIDCFKILIMFYLCCNLSCLRLVSKRIAKHKFSDQAFLHLELLSIEFLKDLPMFLHSHNLLADLRFLYRRFPNIFF